MPGNTRCQRVRYLLCLAAAGVYEKALMPKLTLSRCLHALPALTLALVFGWAAWERFRLPLTPWVDRDVWAYLGPGLDALLGERFREWFGQ